MNRCFDDGKTLESSGSHVGHGSSSPYVTQCPLQQYKEVTSSEAVGKGKTVKTCKHSSIPRKKLLCQSFSVQTKE